jgi:transcription antitermination factor NusG
MSKSAEKQSKLTPEAELLVSFVRRYPLKWYIVYCNPRCERRVFRGLMDGGVFAWLPEQEVERRQPKTKRKFTVRKPIFTRYVFVGVDALRRQDCSVLRSFDGVEGIVKSEQNGVPIALGSDAIAKFVERIYVGEFIHDGEQFLIGDLVTIEAGVFSGFELKVEAVDYGKGVLHGHVPIFGRETPAEVHLDDVKLSA